MMLLVIDTSGIAPNLAGCLRGPGSRVLYAGYLGLAGYEAREYRDYFTIAFAFSDVMVLVLLGLLLMKGVRDCKFGSSGSEPA